MNRRTLWIFVMLVAAVGLVASGTYSIVYLQRRPATPKHAAQEADPATVTEDSPLFIESIRARSYPGSAMTIEQSLGDKGGYREYIVSFVSDGLKEYALLSLPAGAKPVGGYPVIVLVHGYVDPAAYETNSNDYRDFIGTLARAGYAVIKPDFRGHGQSQGVAEGGHYSPVYTYDVLNLLASLKNLDSVNPARVGMIGHSMGGHIALRTIVSTNQVKATAMLAGVVGSMYDIFFNWPHSPIPGDKPTAIVQGNLARQIADHGDPKTNPDYWNQAAAINYVHYITGVVQIDHGDLDNVVPLVFSNHLYRALVAAGKPVEQYNYPLADHQFSNAASRRLLLQRLITMFNQQL